MTMARHRPRAKKTRFRIWWISLPITAIALGMFFYWFYQTNTMMQTEENPFGAIGMLMVYAIYMGVPLLVSIIAGIITIVSLATKK